VLVAMLMIRLLVTGVVTVVLWAVARPFRRLVSMVSLTREQFGGIVPGAGTGPMSRVWQRVRGGEVEDRQSRWWEERRGAAGPADVAGGVRPETEPHGRVPAQATRVTRPRAEVEAPPQPTLVSGARRPALPAGTGGTGANGRRIPLWNEPDAVDDRTIYRRPDTVPLRPGGARPVQPEIVDGVPVYRIYRPRAARTGPG
jgi:hypothetical protein